MRNKKIILGVTGSIASYKCYELVKTIVKSGAEVITVLSEAAQEFVSPLMLKTFSNNALYINSDLINTQHPMLHIELARWADIILIAPASANYIAKLAGGFADDLLSTISLATDAPVALVPAMNQQMWHNKLTQSNIKKTKEAGILIFGPAEGSQACGEFGFGRMIEPAEIIRKLEDLYTPKLLLGKTIVITAGGTIEKIDPVRCITNFSSGKMGYYLSLAARSMGAKVILISSAKSLPQLIGVQIEQVESAQQMYECAMKFVNVADIFIGAAAVADYTPTTVNRKKYKKQEMTWNLELKPTQDILYNIGQLKTKPFLVGFAAETEDIIKNAKKKLKDKNLDMIVANDVSNGKGFGEEDLGVTILKAISSSEIFLEKATKAEIACKILQEVSKALQNLQKVT